MQERFIKIMLNHYPNFRFVSDGRDGQRILPDILNPASHPLTKLSGQQYRNTARALIESGFPVDELSGHRNFRNRDIDIDGQILNEQYITVFARRMVVPINLHLKDMLERDGKTTIDMFACIEVSLKNEKVVSVLRNPEMPKLAENNDFLGESLKNSVIALVKNKYRISKVEARNAKEMTLWVVNSAPRWILIEINKEYLWLAFVTSTNKFDADTLSYKLGVPVKLNKGKFEKSDRVRIKISDIQQLKSTEFLSLLDELYADFINYRGLTLADFDVQNNPYADKFDHTKIKWLKQVGQDEDWSYSEFQEGDIFWLHWPKQSRKNPAKPLISEIIVIKQQGKLSHLVTPISSEVIDTPEIGNWPFAREVICLKFWDKNDAPMAPDIFPFSLQGGYHGNGVELNSLVPRNPTVSLAELQERIWRAFFPNLEPREVAVGTSDRTDEGDEGFLEGRLKKAFRYHHSRERNPEVVKRAKEHAKQRDPYLHCEVCGFSFLKVYGQEYIEAHHIHPISERQEATVTRIEDIALVCANCHRMLHSKQPGINVEKLKASLMAR